MTNLLSVLLCAALAPPSTSPRPSAQGTEPVAERPLEAEPGTQPVADPAPAPDAASAEPADPPPEPDSSTESEVANAEPDTAGAEPAALPEANGAAPKTDTDASETDLVGTETAAESVPESVTAKDSDPPPKAAEPKTAGPKIVVGLQAFVRGQGRVNPDFDKASGTAANSTQIVERFRVNAKATWGPLVGFAQVQEARTFTFDRTSASQSGALTFHQGFAEVGGTRKAGDLAGWIRVGRQEIAWGRQRMVGPLLWAPGARSFDAVRAQGSYKRWTLEGFGAVRTAEQTVQVAGDPGEDPTPIVVTAGTVLAGARIELLAHPAFAVEAMALLDRSDAHPDALGEEHLIVDGGARIWGKPIGGLSYDVEGHFQGGTKNELTHQAWAWAAAVDWTGDRSRRFWPGAGAGYTMGSGHTCRAAADAGCDNAKSQDFFNFYPTNHIHYGIADTMNWANMRDLEARAKVGHRKLVELSAAYHWLQLHQADGRWTNAGGKLVGAGWDPTNDANNLGSEIDVIASVKPLDPLAISAGYALFLPAKAARQLAGDDPQHFLYLWLVATF